MRYIATDEVAWSDCPSDGCLSATIVSRAKTAEPIQMPFGIWILVGQRKHVLDGSPDPTRDGAILRGSGRPMTCPAVDKLKATQQGAALVRCGLSIAVY